MTFLEWLLTKGFKFAEACEIDELVDADAQALYAQYEDEV
jgi:hypothetical protein